MGPSSCLLRSCSLAPTRRRPLRYLKGKSSTYSLRPRAISRIVQTRKAPSRASFVRYRGDCGTRHRRLEKGKPAISAPIQSNRSATPSLLSLLRRPRPHPIGRPRPRSSRAGTAGLDRTRAVAPATRRSRQRRPRRHETRPPSQVAPVIQVSLVPVCQPLTLCLLPRFLLRGL